jgi:hypothetical protein
MRKSFNVKCRIVKASGLSGLLLKGQPVEGFIMVDHTSEEAFKTFVGETFDVRWTLTKAPMMDALPADIKGIIAPVKFTPTSRHLVLTLIRDGVTINMTVGVSEDTNVLNVSATLSKKWSGTLDIAGIGTAER